MNKLLLQFFALMMTVSASLTAQTNDFYDDAPTNTLKGSKKILVTGEVEKEMTIDLNKLPLHSIMVKETTLTDGAVSFVGAYRYDGYSLYDILDKIVLKKKNEAEFPPIIDLYVEVANEAGESVTFSWGEIYYPVNRHRIPVSYTHLRAHETGRNLVCRLLLEKK